MTQNIRLIANNQIMKTIVAIPPILIVLMIAIIAWYFRSLPPAVPLYYSRPWGDDQLAAPLFLLILPLGSLLWYLGTIFLINTQAYQYRVFAQILLLMQVVCSGLATVAILSILHLII